MAECRVSVWPRMCFFFFVCLNLGIHFVSWSGRSLCSSCCVNLGYFNEVVWSPCITCPPYLSLLFLPFSNHQVFTQWLSSRNNLLIVCISGWCFSAFSLKITFSVPHLCPSFMFPWSKTAGLQLLWAGGLLGLVLFPSCAALALDLGLTLGWPWADLGSPWADVELTDFIYWLVSRAMWALVRAIPDF